MKNRLSLLTPLTKLPPPIAKSELLFPRMECECITSAYDYCKKVYGFYWSKFSHYFRHYFSDDVEKRKVRKENFLAVNLGN